MRKDFGNLTLTCLLVVIATATNVNASSLINNTGLSNPDVSLSFSEFPLAPETSVTNQWDGFGVTFSPGLFFNTQPIFFPTESLANFDFIGGVNNPVDILFSSTVSAAAFALQTNPGSSTFSAYLQGVLVEQFSAPTTLSILPDESQASNFYGFEGILFDQLRIESGTTFFQMDNLQFNSTSSVPEPSSLALIGLGGIGLAIGAYRRRRAASV